MIFDGSVKELIKAAYEAEKDVFLKVSPFDADELSFDAVKTAVFLNGAFYKEKDGFFSDYKNPPADEVVNNAPDVLYADIRFAGDENFRRYLKANHYKRFAVLFSECADINEYGWRSSYSLLGELREQQNDFCQIVAFLSSYSDSVDECRAVFASEDAVFAGEDILPDTVFCRMSDERSKKYYISEEAEKYALKKICIYFNSRTEAKDFGKYLAARDTKSIIIDGSSDYEERRINLEIFARGEINILLATKSFIPSSLFYMPEKVFFCGVPFSLSHIYRCKFAAGKSPMKVIYCEDDIKRNIGIIESYSRFLSDNEISMKRQKSLSDIVKKL